MKSFKEASYFQLDSVYNSALKGNMNQATSIMWSGFPQVMRLSGFYVIRAMDNFLQIMDDQLKSGSAMAHAPENENVSSHSDGIGGGHLHPDSLELNQELQKIWQ